jgi:NodT family efflux transporter outer membrane factor (OMF) lipoprotein
MTTGFALAACVQPAPPHPNVPDAWIDGAADPAWPSDTWWTAFDAPELSRLIETALAENRNLAAAAARILQAEAQADVAGANRFPIVSGNASANRSSRSIPGQASDGNTSIVSRSARATVQASYQLDLFGQIRSQEAAALQRIDSSRFDRETVRLTLCADVATTYFQLLAGRDRIGSAEERLMIARQLLTLVETQRGFGTVSDLEVSQQRAQVATQEGALSGLRQAERQSLDALAALTGRPPSELKIEGASLLNLDAPATRPGLPSDLLTRRPDLRRAESDLAANGFDLAAARAARFPSIGLTVQAGSASRELSDLLSAGTFFRNIAANLTAPLFSGNRLESQKRLTEARRAELVANYEQAVLNALRDTEDALIAGRESGTQLAFAEQAAAESATAFRIAEARYRAGTQGFQNVLDAQRSALAADDAVAEARQARLAAAVGLIAALGGGWDATVQEASR